MSISERAARRTAVALLAAVIAAGSGGTRPASGSVVGGTVVLLADDSVKPIEHIRPGDGLAGPRRGSTGKTVRVGTNPVRGVIQLVSEHGQQVELTPEHPVVTPGGAILAGALTVGTVVMTLEGPVRIVEVRNIQFEGVAFNLQVTPATPGERDGNAYFANGFLVGDSRMYVEQRRY